MLTETRLHRERTHVESRTADGEICCSIYPTIISKKCFCLKPTAIDTGDLDVSKMAVGTPFDILMLGGEVVGIDTPAIHPFDLRKRYPEGLDCITAKVENSAEGIYGAVTVKANIDGVDKYFRITSLTLMFQAQQDEELAHRIFKGLQKDDSVVLWVKKDAIVRPSGSVMAQNVQDVECMSKQFR